MLSPYLLSLTHNNTLSHDEARACLNTIFDNGKYTASFDKNTEYHQSETSIGSDVVSITCYDWSVKLQKKNNWVDNLSVELYKNEVVIFIRNNSWLNNQPQDS